MPKNVSFHYEEKNKQDFFFPIYTLTEGPLHLEKYKSPFETAKFT